MLTERFSDETLYQALLDRNAAYDGFAYVCVTSTRIFCRFTCPARKPRRENCLFQTTIVECLNAGFRPCKRCTPMLRYGAGDPLVTGLLEALDADPTERWSEEKLIRLGHDPSTVRRAFKRRFGISFLDMARQRRLSQAVTTLEAGVSVIEAQLDAGFESGSGFRNAINQLIGTSPNSVKNHSLLKADWLETPIGPMLAVTCANALHLLEFADRPALPNELKRLQARLRTGILMGRTPVTEQLQAELAAYFKGMRSNFSLRIGDHGTAFERSVWQRLQEIPAGTNQSYSQIAKDLQRSTAVRAVARANGANQIAILIPCHRVVAADGSLTGYGGGIWRKEWLLRHERRFFTSSDVSHHST